MPKIKTNRGAKKSTKRKRGLRRATLVDARDAKNISRLIPYV